MDCANGGARPVTTARIDIRRNEGTRGQGESLYWRSLRERTRLFGIMYHIITGMGVDVGIGLYNEGCVG